MCVGMRDSTKRDEGLATPSGEAVLRRRGGRKETIKLVGTRNMV